MVTWPGVSVSDVALSSLVLIVPDLLDGAELQMSLWITTVLPDFVTTVSSFFTVLLELDETLHGVAWRSTYPV